MTEVKYTVVDLETTVKNKGEESVGNMQASPFHPDNYIVLAGIKSSTMDSVEVGIPEENTGIGVPKEHNKIIMVGHNVAFDLLHLLMQKQETGREQIKEWMKTGYIWDTMIVEYLLSGQKISMPSLDYCSSKRGLPLKDEKIKDYWESGMETEDIPAHELEEYLIQDVENTEAIFLSQYEEAKEKGMLPLIMTAMEFRLATIEMEFNGMQFDKEQCLEDTEAYKIEIDGQQDTVELYMTSRFGVGAGINTGSNDQISIAIFGGEYKYKMNMPVLGEDGKPIIYKSGLKIGQVKTKITDCSVSVPKAQEYLNTKYAKPTKKRGIYQTGDDVLQAIIQDGVTPPTTRQFCEDVLKLREMQKDLTTYYEGYSKLVWHDGKIHPQYNHAVTKTGRVSCSSPNLQQVSGKDE